LEGWSALIDIVRTWISGVPPLNLLKLFFICAPKQVSKIVIEAILYASMSSGIIYVILQILYPHPSSDPGKFTE